MSGRTCIPVSGRRDTDNKKTAVSSEDNSSQRADGSRPKFTTTCRIRLPGKSELSPVKYLKHLGDKVVSVIRYVSTRTRSSTKVSSSATSKPCVTLTPIDSRREEAISDCIEFINASASLPSGYSKAGKGPHKKEPPANPSAIKTVSALKKPGTPIKTVRVTWAPDVYDPPPSAPDHFAQTRTERHKNEPTSKKNAKNKQKGGGKAAGEGGRGGGGGGAKGKAKQVQKHGGSSNKIFESLDAADRLVD